jgi:hypothetical protein
MNRRRFLAAGGLALLPFGAAAQQPLAAMRYSALHPGGALPPEYQVFAFRGKKRPTEYTLVADEGRVALRARADAAASGIVRRLRVDPHALPMLAWSWKVTRLLEKSDIARRGGDDFPARLYVNFDLDASSLSLAGRAELALARLLYGPEVPAAVLCYVWDTRAPLGSIVPSPFTSRVRILVAESGPARLGRWVAYERNVAQDYLRAFGTAPPAISGVVLMTDTDNTGERAETFYGDVEFRPRRPS